MKKINIPLDEQETFIHFDYKEKTVHIYTTRNSVYTKVNKVLGSPDSGDYLGADWYLSFSDRESIRSAMSMNLYLPRKTNKK